MRYVYLELIQRFGLCKEWVNVPLGLFNGPLIEFLCACGRNRPPIITTWNPTEWDDIFDDAPFKRVMLLPVGTLRFPSSQKDLMVWAGACSGCDRVYFGLACKHGYGGAR